MRDRRGKRQTNVSWSRDEAIIIIYLRSNLTRTIHLALREHTIVCFVCKANTLHTVVAPLCILECRWYLVLLRLSSALLKALNGGKFEMVLHWKREVERDKEDKYLPMKVNP